MFFITNHNTKKEFKNLIEKSNFIYKETIETLRPCINVYYYYDLSAMGLIKDSLDVTSMDIKMSIVAFLNYYSQLIWFKNELTNIFTNNRKLLAHMQDEYLAAVQHPDNALAQVKSVARNIKNFADFRKFPDLIMLYDALVKCLQDAKDIRVKNTTVEI